jgi:hypothetical protein
MSDHPKRLDDYTYRELAFEREIAEAVIRHLIENHMGDGAPPKQVLHTPYLSRMESEVDQLALHRYLQKQQAWVDELARRMEKYHWMVSPVEPRPPFMEINQESQENGKPKEEPRRGRRRQREKDAPKPSEGGGGSVS